MKLNIGDSVWHKKQTQMRAQYVGWKFYRNQATSPLLNLGRTGVLRPPVGGVAEWLKAAVLKTVERLRVPGVRIPPPPPLFCKQVSKAKAQRNLRHMTDTLQAIAILRLTLSVQTVSLC